MDMVTEHNKMIAKFMNLLPEGLHAWHYTNNSFGLRFNTIYFHDELQYHSSWDWLMPVAQRVMKIIVTPMDNDLNNLNHEYYQQLRKYFFYALKQMDQQALYDAVVEILIWYNKIKLR